MYRKTMTAAAAAALTATMILGAPTTAFAAVSAKDTLSQSDIVKAVPELDGGTFESTKAKEIAAPGSTCGSNVSVKVKSSATIAGASSVGFPVATTGAVEFASTAKAKQYLASYAKFAKNCASFTEPATGATVTMQKAKAPKVGQAAIATTQTVAISGITSYSASVVIRDGKRIAQVAVIDDAAVSSTQINALAKVAAKKLK